MRRTRPQKTSTARSIPQTSILALLPPIATQVKTTDTGLQALNRLSILDYHHLILMMFHQHRQWATRSCVRSTVAHNNTKTQLAANPLSSTTTQQTVPTRPQSTATRAKGIRGIIAKNPSHPPIQPEHQYGTTPKPRRPCPLCPGHARAVTLLHHRHQDHDQRPVVARVNAARVLQRRIRSGVSIVRMMSQTIMLLRLMSALRRRA
jgi:hypothetical protein